MNFPSALLFIVCALTATIFAQDQPPRIKLEEALTNDQLMQTYIDCVLEKGPCDPASEDIRVSLPEALEKECNKCNADDKEEIKKLVKHLTENKQDWWKALLEKYDPEGKYRTKYAELAAKEGLKIQ